MASGFVKAAIFSTQLSKCVFLLKGNEVSRPSCVRVELIPSPKLMSLEFSISVGKRFEARRLIRRLPAQCGLREPTRAERQIGRGWLFQCGPQQRRASPSRDLNAEEPLSVLLQLVRPIARLQWLLPARLGSTA